MMPHFTVCMETLYTLIYSFFLNLSSLIVIIHVTVFRLRKLGFNPQLLVEHKPKISL